MNCCGASTRIRKLASRILLVLCLAGMPSAPAEACPGCREALAAGSAEADQLSPGALARGFNSSILLMATMPFFIFGGVVWLAARD